MLFAVAYSEVGVGLLGLPPRRRKNRRRPRLLRPEPLVSVFLADSPVAVAVFGAAAFGFGLDLALPPRAPRRRPLWPEG